MRLAITRAVSESMSRCELTHKGREPIDIAAARAQHRAYRETLSDLGVAVLDLPQRPGAPDSVFVEDIAVAFDEVAVLTRPGAASRRTERPEVESILRRLRPCQEIVAPGTLDGGDVLAIGRRVWVGVSSRTNEEGIRQFASILSPLGYSVSGLRIEGCLHLKSAATPLGPERVLVDPRSVDPRSFDGLDWLETDPSEPLAANVLTVGDVVLVPASCPRTAERIEAIGLRTLAVDCSEVAKAEGALTCCSIVLSI